MTSIIYVGMDVHLPHLLILVKYQAHTNRPEQFINLRFSLVQVFQQLPRKYTPAGILSLRKLLRM